MNLRKVLRVSVVVQLLLSMIYYIVSKKLIVYLPKELRDYEMSLYKQESTNIDLLIMVILVTMILGQLISLIGLFFILPWAKWFYTTVFVIMLIFALFMGPTVDHALGNIIGSLSSIATGIIFCLLFFTNVMSDDRGENGVRVSSG